MLLSVLTSAGQLWFLHASFVSIIEASNLPVNLLTIDVALFCHKCGFNVKEAASVTAG